MLIKNKSDKLVNGLRGLVTGLAEHKVTVHFATIAETHTFQAEEFTR